MSFSPHGLEFLENTLDFLSLAERRRRIVQIASAWVTHKRIGKARRVLKLAGEDFLTDELPALVAADRDIAHAVTLLVEAFGLDFATTLFAKETSC